jgi:amphi-Trp domain-containing protein
MSLDYEAELTGSREEIVSVVAGVVDGLSAGSLDIDTDEGTATVDVPDEIALEIECESDGDEFSLELELEWSDPSVAVEEVTADESTQEENLSTGDEPATPVEAVTPAGSFARFEVYQDRAEEWRWRLRHRNGNVIATSGEGYTRKHNAQKGLRSVVQNAPGAEVTDDGT